MPKYIVERELPGAGDWTPQEMKGVSQVSCGVLAKMGPEIEWVHSYVAGDKVYCIYIAPNEKKILEHALKTGFPANKITKITAIIDPVTAE